MRKAIIVPGVTDLNKGDQALVWESYRLVDDLEIFDKIYILNSGDTEVERKKLCSQSESKGFKFVEKILKHPRRGKHKDKEVVTESFLSFCNLAFNALRDFLTTYFLLLICRNKVFVELFFNKKIVASINEFNKADVIFVKGGGFIHAYGERTAPYLMWYFLFYVRLAKRLGKKVVFLPNSYGPFKGVTVKYQIKKVFMNLDKIFAREFKSSRKLEELLGKKIEVSPDLGFYLQPASKLQSLDLIKKYKFNREDKIIGITVRPWRFPGMINPEEKYENYINVIVYLISYLINKNYKVALCNQSIGPNAHEDDRNAIKEVLAKVSHHNVVWINENLPCDELKSLYSNFYAFIGTRFHSVIFSLTSFVPSIAIGYGGNKAKGIMNDFELNDYLIQIEEISNEVLISKFNHLVEQHNFIKSHLEIKVNQISKERKRIISSIKLSI